MVSADDVAKAEAEGRSAEAHVQVKEIECEEPALRRRNVERWRGRIRQVLDSMQNRGENTKPGSSSELK
jgi:hypothetical protein